MSELNTAIDEIAVPPPQKVKGNRITYSGDTGDVYRIWALNVFLTAITLGIYSFWGKTRLRRYVTGCFALANDHFEYTGTAKELLLGFLKVLPFFLLYIALSVFAGEVITGIYVIGIMFLIPVAIFMSLRYRLNRLTWRGIRGRLSGSAMSFGLLYWGRYLLNAVTLGYLIPASDMRLFEEVTKNTQIGSLRMSFKAKPSGKLIKTNIVTGIIAAVIYLVLIGGLGFVFGASLVAGMGLGSFVMAAIFFVVMIALIMGVRGYYQAQLRTEQLAALRLGDLRFRYLAKGADVAKLRIGNMCLLLFTLGLGKPLVVQRNMRFLAQFTLVGGDLDNVEMMQAAKDASNIGEGMDDVMGLDADLGI